MFNTKNFIKNCCLFLSCSGALFAGEQLHSDWYHTNAQIRTLSQLSSDEFDKFSNSALIDVEPVIAPNKENLVGANDYYMWPIATIIEDTMVVLYSRSTCHWGKEKSQNDGQGGIRMTITSSDGGLTWSKPVDVLQAGRWEKTPFKGFGGGIGSHGGIVYIALTQGIYRSADKGRTWSLLGEEPQWDQVPKTLWAPGMRLTFDDKHGLTIWTTSGFSQDYLQRRDHNAYGTHMVSVYSPDFGRTWKSESQPLPDGLRLSEVTPIQFNNKIAFFLRNGLKKTCFGQGFSETGWFPFTFAISNIGPVGIVDTPDIQYNPRTQRMEAAAPHRKGLGPGPQGQMKVNLYSMTPAEMAAGETAWRYDGTLIRYKNLFGKSDGFNVVGSVVDETRNRRFFHVWGGNGTNTAAVFQYSISLDTDKVSGYLRNFYKTAKSTKTPNP
ncbi:MAG: sialidase family protein [Kiritimatiellae bacterium]|nr:sialidase family protein [Kiritimatiellia bacterium]